MEEYNAHKLCQATSESSHQHTARFIISMNICGFAVLWKYIVINWKKYVGSYLMGVMI